MGVAFITPAYGKGRVGGKGGVLNVVDFLWWLSVDAMEREAADEVMRMISRAFLDGGYTSTKV